MENAKKKTRNGKTLITHNGFSYKLKYEGSNSILYWCTLNRSIESDCSAKLKVIKATGFQESIGCHSAKCNHRNKSISSALVDITNLSSSPAQKNNCGLYRRNAWESYWTYFIWCLLSCYSYLGDPIWSLFGDSTDGTAYTLPLLINPKQAGYK